MEVIVRVGTAENRSILLVTGLAVWFALALLVAVVLGRGIRLVDRQAAVSPALTTADLPVDMVAAL
jgi:hypothetical protein